MLLMLVQNLQLLYHNHQQQVDMENYMNYKSTAENKQKGNQATMATMLGGSSSLLLVYFVAEVQRHLQARHMYYSGSSCLVWTEYFFDIEFGSFSLSSPCGSSLSSS